MICVAREAQEAEKSVREVKGSMVLAPLVTLVDATPVTTRMWFRGELYTCWLMHAWFKTENHRDPFYTKQRAAH